MNSIPRSRYPGRFIIMGKDGDEGVIIYGALGRNESSLNRRYVRKDDSIIALQLQEGGDPELLEYTAFRFSDKMMIVGNGRQSDLIQAASDKDSAHERLAEGLSTISCEPDKYATPRISGMYLESPTNTSAALHIVRIKEYGIEEHAVWDIPLISSKGSYIATYAGEDIRPTPSFLSDPAPVTLSFGSAEKAAQDIYDMFAPSNGVPDYRVSVIACYKKKNSLPQITIINKIDIK